MNAEPYQLLTCGEIDVNDLFTTKLQEGACAAHLRGEFTNTDEVKITMLKGKRGPSFPSVSGRIERLTGNPSGSRRAAAGPPLYAGIL